MTSVRSPRDACTSVKEERMEFEKQKKHMSREWIDFSD